VAEIQGLQLTESLKDDLLKKRVQIIMQGDIDVKPHHKRMDLLINNEIQYDLYQLKGKSDYRKLIELRGKIK
jgi:hypothetical protein